MDERRAPPSQTHAYVLGALLLGAIAALLLSIAPSASGSHNRPTAATPSPWAGLAAETGVYLPLLGAAQPSPTRTPTRIPGDPTATPIGTPPPAGDGQIAPGDWAMFRRDAQHSAATNQELSGSLRLRWKRGFTEWPHVFAELAVVQGRVYLANMDGKITAMSADTGAILWEFDTGAPIPTTPAVVGGRVHVVNLKGRVITFDTSGRMLWEYRVPSDVYASPVVADDRLFFGTVAGVFYAFDAANGGAGPLWAYNVGAVIDTSPVEMNGTIIFAAETMKAYALNAADGSVRWTASLPGTKTWNGHPVASTSTNRVLFTTLTEIYEPSQTYREVFAYPEFESRDGALSELAAFADTFIAQNRVRLTPATLLDATTGAAVTRFTVAPDNRSISGLPFNSWYWGSIRPVLWKGDQLLLQSMRRNIMIDLRTNRIYQPNSSQTATGHFVRGDEQVPISIGGNHAYGGIGQNVAYLNLNDGSRGNLLGVYGSESADFTPLTPPLAAEHYITFPGNGGSDPNGTFIVAGGRGYFVQYGWVYCFDGILTERP